MNFQTTLLGWHDFYSITGAGAASLVGLLFVGLSLHLRVVVTRPEVEGLARVTLMGFSVTLVAALFMVVFVGGDYQDGSAVLSGVAIFLLLTSLRTSWDLLVSVGAAIQVPANA